ncbi:MAG: molybdopterin-containing oxidoreductase family protein [Bacillota bacterium]
MVESGDPYPIHAAIIFRLNPMKSSGQSSRWEAALKKLDLLVAVDTQWSETARLAHYVLPESHYLERDETISVVGDTVSIRQPVVPRVYPETKAGWEIIKGLAEACGIGQYFDFTMDDYNNRLLAPTGWTVQQLKEQGVIKVGATPPNYGKFGTPSGKIQLIQPQWQEAGGSLVVEWVPPKTQPEGNKLRFLHGHSPVHTNGYTQNNPQLFALMPENDLWIHTKTAAARGIKDGDLVEVSNEFGTGRIRAKVTDAIREDSVWMCHGFGTKSPEQRLAYGKGCNDSEFYPIMVTPIAAALGQGDAVVTVRKVGG